MEMRVLESKKNRLVFELQGSDHTFCNILKEALREDKTVSISAYNIDHPLVGVPTFIVEGDDPKKSLHTAVLHLKKQNKAFVDALTKLR